MLKRLRKMLIIGASIAICSVTCMYIWVLLEWLFGNEYRLGMSYCYCLIFIEALAQYPVIGACIDGGLRKSNNSPGSGVLVSVLSEGLLCWLVYLLLPSYIQLIGVSASWLPVLNFFVGYSAISYLLQTVLVPITFDDKETLATVLQVVFYIFSIGVLLLTGWTTGNEHLTYFITLGVSSVYVLGISLWSVKCARLEFAIPRWLKMQLVPIIGVFVCIIVYFLDIFRVSRATESMLLSMTFTLYVTDIQWDMLGAVASVRKIEVSHGERERKQTLIAAYVYLGILIVTELVLILCLHTSFSGLHLMFFLLDFGIQLLHMGLSTAYDIQAVDLGVFAPTKNLALVLLVSNGVRVGCSFLLQTPYAAMLGQVGYSVTAFICYSCLSRKYLKRSQET